MVFRQKSILINIYIDSNAYCQYGKPEASAELRKRTQPLVKTNRYDRRCVQESMVRSACAAGFSSRLTAHPDDEPHADNGDENGGWDKHDLQQRLPAGDHACPGLERLIQKPGE